MGWLGEDDDVMLVTLTVTPYEAALILEAGQAMIQAAHDNKNPILAAEWKSILARLLGTDKPIKNLPAQ